MIMNMKTFFTIAALSLLAATNARAEFVFACGDKRELGPEQAEIAFVDTMEVPMKLAFAGKAVDDDKLGVKAETRGRWIVSVDRGAGQGVLKLVFKQGAPASVQQSLVSDQGDEKKLGAAKPCIFEQK